MEPVVIAAVVAVIIYLAVVMLLPKGVLEDKQKHTREALARLAGGQDVAYVPDQSAEKEENSIPHDNVLVKAFLLLPGSSAMLPAITKAGLDKKLDQFILFMLMFFLCMLAIFAQKFGALGLLIAFAVTFIAGWFIVKRKIKKRKNKFLTQFPDALDMIVRSVKSGYPLNAAIGMIAQNMEAPISEEFQQIVDETTYGTPLISSLQRMAKRLDNKDVRFLVVVLTVQQESGGNLSEVVGKLSTIIRKRRMLKLKARALSAEGRLTAWFLGGLPVVVSIAINIMAPGHFDPFFDTTSGQIALAIILCGLLGGMYMIQKIIDIDV